LTAGCERFRGDLAALRRGEEPELPRTELSGHLNSCAECRAAQRLADRLDALLDEYAPRPAPEVLARLRRSVAAAALRPSPGTHPRRLVPAGAAAVLAVLAAAAAFLLAAWLPGRGPRRTEQKPSATAGVFTEGVGLECDTPGAALPVPGQPLAAGQRLRVAGDGRVCLVLHRGAQLELAGGSAFEIVNESAIRLERGRVLALVSKGGTPFRVHTAEAEVLTLGTRFTVLAETGLTSLAVTEGRVRFSGSRPGNGSVEVAAGEFSSTAGGAPQQPRGAGPDELAWAAFRDGPRLDLELLPARAVLERGDRAAATLRLTNRGGAPVTVDGTGLSRPGYFIRTEDPAGRRSHFAPLVTAARCDGERTGAPQVRLRSGGVLDLDLDLGRLDLPGQWGFTAVYLESAASASTDWSGARQSAPVRVTVRAPDVPAGEPAPQVPAER
jgi:ferric-dicitrate binding protein FerR (iron transport regulator)